jgi:hypothetical protein
MTAAPKTWDWHQPPARACPRCGEQTVERQCKIVCEKCGAFADCGDP